MNMLHIYEELKVTQWAYGVAVKKLSNFAKGIMCVYTTLLTNYVKVEVRGIL